MNQKYFWYDISLTPIVGITLVQYDEKIFINKFFMALKSNICHFRVKKSKMAAKIQDGGRIFLCHLTKKLDIALKNYHTKTGACCQSVTS